MSGMIARIWIVAFLLGGCLAPSLLWAQRDTTRRPLQAAPDTLPPQQEQLLLPGQPSLGDSLSLRDSTRLVQDPLAADTARVDTAQIASPTGEADVDNRPHWKKLLVGGKRPPYDPKVAWQRSAIFPGWGQIYNKSWWKLPIVYGGYGAMFYFYSLQNDRYQGFRDAYLFRVDGDPNTEDTVYAGASDDNVRRARDAARRQRDYAILYIGVFHVLQVVEAFVDAHLKNFDVSEDLTLQTRPGVLEVPGPAGTSYHAGISITLGF